MIDREGCPRDPCDQRNVAERRPNDYAPSCNLHLTVRRVSPRVEGRDDVITQPLCLSLGNPEVHRAREDDCKGQQQQYWDD